MGVVHGCRAAIPHLQRNGSGLLINVASAAAFASAPGMGSYNATKAAVLSLSETLVDELRGAGTQVSVVMPTFFRTESARIPRGPAEARAQADRADGVLDLPRRRCRARRARCSLARAAPISCCLVRRGRSGALKRWTPNLFLRKARRNEGTDEESGRRGWTIARHWSIGREGGSSCSLWPCTTS